ncbi:MAG: winged helix DNA-binding protein [Chloroflexi bacterium]|jgi:DNA-binding MarR family transcriptional regulator|nr:winged helix DNA-binding protein [Chloroflexota bacterium]
MDTAADNQSPIKPELGSEYALTLSEEHEIWVLLGQVSDGMLRARDNELRPFGLSSIQVGVLYIIKAAGGSLTAIEISRRLVRRPATVYQLLDRMDRQDLINCIRSKEGKREVRVEVTEKGEEAYRSHSRQVIPRILGSLSAKERDKLKATLTKLRTKVFEELAEQPMFP